MSLDTVKFLLKLIEKRGPLHLVDIADAPREFLELLSRLKENPMLGRVECSSEFDDTKAVCWLIGRVDCSWGWTRRSMGYVFESALKTLNEPFIIHIIDYVLYNGSPMEYVTLSAGKEIKVRYEFASCLTDLAHFMSVTKHSELHFNVFKHLIGKLNISCHEIFYSAGDEVPGRFGAPIHFIVYCDYKVLEWILNNFPDAFTEKKLHQYLSSLIPFIRRHMAAGAEQFVDWVEAKLAA